MRFCYIGNDKKKETDDIFLELFRKNGNVKYVDVSNISLLIDGGINFVYEYEDISKFDALFFRIPRSKYELAASILDALPKNISCLTSPKAFQAVSSRLSLYRILSLSNINVPKVIFSDNPQTSIFDLNLLRFPVMIKVPTDKKKVMLANSQQEAKSMVDALQVLEQPILFEEYYPEAKVIHAFVLGDEVVAALTKKPEDINYVGGKLKKIKPSKKVVQLALKVADTLNTEFLRVDILDTAEPIVVDANLCPFLADAIKASDVDIPKKVVLYLKSKVESKNKAEKLFDEVKSIFS